MRRSTISTLESGMRLKYFISIFATVIIRHGSIVNANASDPLCDEPSSEMCADGYQCRKGEKDYTTMGFPDLMSYNDSPGFDGRYCDCEEDNIEPGSGKFGMTGQACTTMFQKCPDNIVCFHGASCQKGAANNYYCDCASASYPSGKKYVGENCQYEAEECESGQMEKYDLSGSTNGNWLCANGSCRNDAVSPTLMCACKTGFDGYHCEFQGTAPKCEVDCENNGICKIGVKNFDNLSPALQEYFDLQVEGHDAHCICPTSFTGLHCEIRKSPCGDTHCLNGSICKFSFDFDNQYHCDCGEIPGLKMYAGDSCESASTSVCDAPLGYNREFCTNNGRCPKNAWDACECPVDYSGPRCEFLIQHHKECDLPCKNGGTCSFDSTFDMYCKCPVGLTGDRCTEKMTSYRAEGFMWTYLMLVLVVVLVLFGFILYRHRTENKHDTAADDNHPVETISDDEAIYNGNTIT